MAATEKTNELSSIDRHNLHDALQALQRERGALELDAIVECSGVSRDTVIHLMEKQAADPWNPVRHVDEGVWIVEE